MERSAIRLRSKELTVMMGGKRQKEMWQKRESNSSKSMMRTDKKDETRQGKGGRGGNHDFATAKGQLKEALPTEALPSERHQPP